jgi:hypothetical protein
MTTQGFFSYRDHSSEIGNVRLFFDNMDAGGANYDAVVASIVAVEAEIQDCSLCDQAGYGYRDEIGGDTGTSPASNLAQRESCLRVFLVDDSNAKRSHFTIPGPDLANLTIPVGTDQVTLADASIMADLVTAVEANCQSIDGNSLTVEKAYIVGRNN